MNKSKIQELEFKAIELVKEMIGRNPSKSEIEQKYYIQSNFLNSFNLSDLNYDYCWGDKFLFSTNQDGNIVNNEQIIIGL